MCEVEEEHPKYVRWTCRHGPDLLDELENTKPNIVIEKKKSFHKSLWMFC